MVAERLLGESHMHQASVSALLLGSALLLACGAPDPTSSYVSGDSAISSSDDSSQPPGSQKSAQPGKSASPAPSGKPAPSGSSATDLGPAPMANFLKVTDGIYRGGHPDDSGLDYLKKLGIKTDLDLEIGDFIESMPADITAEQQGAESRGLTFINTPMSAYEPALSTRFDDQMNKILGILQDPASKPIYVHCKHGQDRTGLVIGLERVLIEHQTPQAAHDEMVKIGFHTALIGLEDYFERKTGWTP
jgi:hypothetical protein